MAEVVDKAKEVADSLGHPVETAKSLEREAEQGRSARTPLIAVTGVTLVIGVVLAVVLVAAFLVYYLV